MLVPTDSQSQRQTLLELAAIPSFGAGVWRQLIAAFGDLDGVSRQPIRRMAEVLSPTAAKYFREGPSEAAKEARSRWLEKPNRSVLTLADPLYPLALRTLLDPPPVIWLYGEASLLHHPALAIVGSRRASPQGLQDARAFSKLLGEGGLTIVSGLAEGIDRAAHEGALTSLGRTIAVLAHGLDRIYPPSHRDLGHQIVENGLLISEYPLQTQALKYHFPERNRLISGISLGVLVIEATLGSGSLITAQHGLEQGREVMAIPGSIHSPFSKGCHQLIRQGATLVETVQDVWAQLESSLRRYSALPGLRLKEGDPISEENPVNRVLQSGMASVDEIVNLTCLTASQVSSILGQEELAGRVVRLADGRYQQLVPLRGLTEGM
jgi:DNA processing protein